jgi:hypothetical protein
MLTHATCTQVAPRRPGSCMRCDSGGKAVLTGSREACRDSGEAAQESQGTGRVPYTGGRSAGAATSGHGGGSRSDRPSPALGSLAHIHIVRLLRGLEAPRRRSPL